MGSWFWWNIPLALLFFGAWTIIPLWLVLTRWHRETEAKHAEIAAYAAARTALEIDEFVSSVSVETVSEPSGATVS